MLSPMKILGRGYALAYHGEELVRSAAQVQSGDVLRVQLAEGEITAKAVSYTHLFMTATAESADFCC